MKYIFLILLFSACSGSKHNGKNIKNGELIFQSGFEPGSKVIPKNNDSDITGADQTLKDHNDWVADLDNHPNIGNFGLQYEGGDSTMRFAKIIPEPGNPTNHVLQFWLNEPNVKASKGRIQGNLYGNNGLKDFSQSVRMFLPDDFNAVKQYPKEIHWLTIAEFWNNITWSQTVPYRFRVTLGIGKLTASPDNLHFILDAEDCALFPDNSQKYTTIWKENNKDIDVPIGQWFTMEYYYKEGGADSGRFYMAITPAGKRKQVVFDLTRITHNTQDPAPDGVSDFNPIKLYTSKDLIGFMKGQHKTLQIYWDDFRFWKGRGNF